MDWLRAVLGSLVVCMMSITACKPAPDGEQAAAEATCAEDDSGVTAIQDGVKAVCTPKLVFDETVSMYIDDHEHDPGRYKRGLSLFIREEFGAQGSRLVMYDIDDPTLELSLIELRERLDALAQQTGVPRSEVPIILQVDGSTSTGLLTPLFSALDEMALGSIDFLLTFENEDYHKKIRETVDPETLRAIYNGPRDAHFQKVARSMMLMAEAECKDIYTVLHENVNRLHPWLCTSGGEALSAAYTACGCAIDAERFINHLELIFDAPGIGVIKTFELGAGEHPIHLSGDGSWYDHVEVLKQLSDGARLTID